MAEDFSEEDLKFAAWLLIIGVTIGLMCLGGYFYGGAGVFGAFGIVCTTIGILVLEGGKRQKRRRERDNKQA